MSVETFTWQNTNTSWATSGNWSLSSPGGLTGPPGNDFADLATDIAAFPAVSSGIDQPNIQSNDFFVLGVTIDDSGTQKYNPTGSAGVLTVGANGISLFGTGTNTTSSGMNIRVGTTQTWNIDTGNTFTQTGGFSGAHLLTKDGDGTLLLNNATGTPNRFAGGYNIVGGTLQGGSAATQSAHVLRSNPINIGASGTLSNAGGSNPSLSLGQLSGSGAASLAANTRPDMYIFADANYSGTMTVGGTTGNLDLRFGNDAVQTFSGNVSTVRFDGGLSVSRGATLKLTGTGGNGELTGHSFAITMRGGKILLDNSGGNTTGGTTTNRLDNANSVTFLGGTIAMVGSSSGSTETLAGLTMNAGAASVQVTNTAGGAGAQLTFSSFGRGSGLAGTINFVGDGNGTLGSAGDNPRIVFTSAPGTTNGVIANSGGSGILGFATVNGTDFASYGADGVVAVSTTTVSGALTSASTQNSSLNNNATIGASDVVYNTLKIAPSAGGQSLDLTGTGHLTTTGVLLAGNTDFTIQNTGGGTGGLTASNQRFVHVANAGTTLSIAVPILSDNHFTKSGEGILALTGSSSQFSPSANLNIGIASGVLRASLTSLGGGTSGTNTPLGAFTTLQLRGGVLEISGGGTLTRALDASGNASGGGITFDQGATDQGGGGFSAIDGDATVRFVTNNSSSTLSAGGSMRWGNGSFVPTGHALIFGSTKANSKITLANEIELDSGAAGNEYFGREVRVIDNPGSSTDRAELSGEVIGGNYADLIKTGGGTLELSRAAGNSYSGNTLVVGGTLLANNTSGSGTGSGLVKVSIDGTFGGSGIVSGPVVVESGGKVAPGASIESLAVGSLTLMTGSAFVYEINSQATLGVAADLLTTASELSIAPVVGMTGVDLSLGDIAAISSPLAGGTKFTLAGYIAGMWNGGTFKDKPDGSTVTVGVNQFVLDYDDIASGVNFVADLGSSNRFVTLTSVIPIPEPSVMLFGGLLCGGLGLRYLKRRLVAAA
ncbi:MAG: autotransporter-associated beta strand repeat-containing protein [Pirellulales bacterium]